MNTPLERHINNLNEHGKYILEANLDDNEKPLYRLLKKFEKSFVEIDSFNGYEDASEEAKLLIKELTAPSLLASDRVTINSPEAAA
ncbi:hypothetical protein ACSMDY_01800 [Raoultella ornithinolytica]|uniref:hypothetical protein n=1 Tax=Raoultella ornithinolytica TaxID=54291 RepID=UPI003F19359C